MSTKQTKMPLTPEWSLKVDVSALGAHPLRVALAATEEQRRDLARRLKIDAIDSIGGTLSVQRRPGSHLIQVSGTVEAAIRQSCVVTLAPVESRIAETVEAWFSDEDRIINP